MTEKLYLKDSYLKEFEAKVSKVINGKFVVLDKTAFYPVGGGQPTDTGKLVKGKEEFRVVFAKQFGEEVSHEVENCSLKEGDQVKGVIDWEKRYKLMRMHSAAHVLSAVIFNEINSMITGNQLELDESRMDFNVADFDRNLLTSFEEKSNELVEKKLPITINFMPKEEAFRIPSLFRLKGVLPKNLEILRVVSIGDFDVQADGGTHVKNTGEIGKIKITRLKNKGADNRRIYFALE